MRGALLCLLIAAGCNGDNLEKKCELREAPVLPPEGPLADPLAIELPADCVVDGLRDAAGRWFVRDSEQLFEFSYPLLESTCEGGVRLAGIDDDHSIGGDDHELRHTWWDGTRLFTRSYFKFEFQDFLYEFASTTTLCMLPDGTLAGRWSTYNTDQPEIQTGTLIGTRFTRREPEQSLGLELVGERRVSSNGGAISAYNLAVEGGFAYLAGPRDFHIVDVTDPEKPKSIASLDEPFNDVRLVHGTDKDVVIGASFREDATILVDVTDPTAPVVAGAIPAYSHSLQVAGNLLYLADYTNAVPTYDITDPLVPLLVGAPMVPDSEFGIHDLTVDGDLLFVNQTTAGFVVLDNSVSVVGGATKLARQPTSYSHASWIGMAGGRRLALHGDEGLTGTADGAAFLRVLDGDRTSATFLQELGRYQSRPEVGIHNIEMHGDRAYIAYYQDGVRVVDLSDPANPREIAYYNTWDEATAPSGGFTGALGIRVVDGLIYVADSERGLVILRETL